ncbi:MAG TPA: MFS transporter [bacterium]|nr:MFS transporter [bacterium]
MPSSKTITRSLSSWALYDFANTIFSALVLTTYFPLYLTEIAGANWYLGFATTASMILAGLVIPFIGALSDKTGRTKSYLIRTTLVCILFMFLLSATKNSFLLILIFLCACFFYHASLVFYNSLLPVAAPGDAQGFASGLGTGLGYLGVVFALPLAHWVDQTFGRAYVFSLGALLFLIFSLPLLLFVPERAVPDPIPFRWNLWKSEWQKILKTIRSLDRNPALLLFFGGNFFAVDALNSAIFWLAVYAREVFHPAQNQLIFLLMGINIAAFVSGIMAGFLTDRFGALKIMTLAVGTLAVTLGLLATVPQFPAFVALTLTGGAFAIAGIWTAGRKALIDFAPKEEIGEYFGLYGLTTKVSVIGSLLFSIAADLAGFRTALWVLVFPATVGFLCLLFSKILKPSL